MRCIYCGENSENSTKHEHVISAFLGGKSKLPIGYVCDNCNECFSKIELEQARGGVIGLCRMFEGPGKRGSISENKQYNSDVYFSNDELGNVNLVYLSKGKPCNVNRLEIDCQKLKEDKVYRMATCSVEDSYEFMKGLKKVSYGDLMVEENSEYLDENQIFIYYDYPQSLRNNVKGFDKRYFKIFKGLNVSENQIKEVIDIINTKDNSINVSDKSESRVNVSLKMVVHMHSFERFIIKNMLNTLAFFEGNEIFNNIELKESVEYVLGNIEFSWENSKCRIIEDKDVLGFLDDFMTDEMKG